MTQATEYFKRAAANLRGAIQVKQDTINQLRHDISDKDTEMRQRVADLEDDIRTKERDLAAPTDQQIEPNVDKSTKLRQVAQLQSQIVDARRDFDKQRDEINKAIAQLEREMQELRQQASNFESRQ